MEITPEPIDDPCPCAYCIGHSIMHYDSENRPFVYNNVHDELRPCEECGRAKSEHVDYGNKGAYQCWWCEERAAGPSEISENLPDLNFMVGEVYEGIVWR